MSELKSMAVLVKTVFSSEEGQKLLKELNEIFSESPLFDLNDKMVYYRIGKRDLIKELNFYYKATEKDLKEIEPNTSDEFFK